MYYGHHTPAPTQWCLTKHDTINTFENWKQNLIYTLSLDANFAEFIATDAQWQKKTAARPDRGLIGNNDAKPRQRVYIMLELMLGQIANYCPVISRNTIVNQSINQSINLYSISDTYSIMHIHSKFTIKKNSVEVKRICLKLFSLSVTYD